jgi:hypothetical protein
MSRPETLQALFGISSEATFTLPSVPMDRLCDLVVRVPGYRSIQIQRSRVRFPALPDFLRSSGSGTEPTQLREDN